MIVTTPEITRAEFERGTGWQLRPEGACRGDVCIPIADAAGDSVDVVATADAMGLPVVRHEGLTAVGPWGGSGRTLVTAEAPELHPLGLEVVTVGLDTAGAEACRPFIEAAQPSHPSLTDQQHAVAELFGVINIPNGVWIDENGIIVRPAETAPAPRREERAAAGDMGELPERMVEIFTEAQKIRSDPQAYEAALRDWVANGADSPFALSPAEVIERSQPRDDEAARGQAHFELATHLHAVGKHDAAVEHFRAAHELVPTNFSYKRQAWSLEPGPDGPLQRFWQGPSEGADWPYAGDWLTDVREFGAENYYAEWRP